MKKIAIISVLIWAAILLTACKSKENNTSIEGLWLVEKVQMGTQEMTPIARWTRFNANYTQSSGNGWLQHSVGSWGLDGNKLSVENTNGISDGFEPFQVSLEGEKMIWKRKEEKDTVHVFLKKIEKLPTSKGNDLFGLWKLVGYAENGVDATSKINVPERAMIHFRWDNVYVQHNMPAGKRSGVYKIHGHKPEIQMINYGDGNSFDFWKFEIVDDMLIMTSTDKTTEIKFKRSHQFPQ
ncbi:hypothetical protein RQM59_06850 [Flavobacteriaceae bacterium S356]|uniref:Lipocalin-like domain-containing protein n=1 Tax=Asprobacillus argus TaxID=3076534 RepID=A0ABU3LGA7_9FLAO|nr:hypothetical protein [Flavobacteriaceae bacterium S356]